MRQSQIACAQKNIGKLHIDKTDWKGVTKINYTMLAFTMAISDCYQTSAYLFWLVQFIKSNWKPNEWTTTKCDVVHIFTTSLGNK